MTEKLARSSQVDQTGSTVPRKSDRTAVES